MKPIARPFGTLVDHILDHRIPIAIFVDVTVACQKLQAGPNLLNMPSGILVGHLAFNVREIIFQERILHVRARFNLPLSYANNRGARGAGSQW